MSAAALALLLGVAGVLLLTSASGSAQPAGKGARGADGSGASPRIGKGKGGFKLSTIGVFDQPVYVTGPAGANGQIFVVEQSGKIVTVGKKGNHPTFLDMGNDVESGGERGLLSVAFSPDYATSGRFYVYFTKPGGDIVIREYQRSGKNAKKADPKSGRNVIEIPHTENANHNGGQLQFGPDGMLYAGTGDGGSAYDPPENAQNKNVLLGKLLRIDPRKNGDKPYSVPNDNPFVGGNGKPEIYSYGLRNPFRYSFDSKTGMLVIGDVGQDRYEEVDYESLNSAKGANFGWDALEGTHPLNEDASPDPGGTTPPIFEYSHDDGNCSITGGFISRDKRIKSLYGRYLYADFCKGQIRSLVPSSGGASGDRSAGLPVHSGVSSFGQDTRGRTYVANVTTGEVAVIKPSGKKRK